MGEKILTYANRLIAYSFYALFFFVPLVLSNATSELFEFNKMWLTFALTLLIALGWGTKMLVERQIRIQRTPLDIPIVLFLLSQCISTLFSIDRHVSIWGYYSRFNGGLLSILTYIFLYYAFVTNFRSITDTCSQHLGLKLSPAWRTGLVVVGTLLILAGINLAKPDPTVQGSVGAPILLWIFLWCSFFLFLAALPKDFLKRLLLITLTSSAIVSIWGILSHFGADPTCLLFRGTFDVSCWTNAFQPEIRAFSTLGQPAWFVAYLSVTALIAAGVGIAYAIGLVSERQSISAKKHHEEKQHTVLLPSKASFIALFVVSLLAYAGVIFGNTRAGIIGFWIGDIAFWGIIFFRKSLTSKLFLNFFLLFNLSFVFMTFIWGAPVPVVSKFMLPELMHAAAPAPAPVAATSSSSTPTSPGDLGGTDSGKIRLFVWQGALKAWMAHPIFGTGVETFAFAYYQYRPAGHNMTSEWDYLYNKAHNEYLNYLATTGAFGLGSYLSMIIVFGIVTLFWIIKNEKMDKAYWFSSTGDRVVVVSFLGAYLTILISNFFGFSVVIMNLFLFLIPAMTLPLMNKLDKNNEFVLPQRSKKGELEPGGLQWTGIIILTIITLVLLLNLKHSWNADKEYALGTNLISSAGNDSQAIITGVQDLTTAVNMRPSEPVFRDELSIGEANIAALILLQKDSSQGAQLQTQAQQLITQATSTSDQLTSEYPNNIVFWKDKVRMYNLLAEGDPRYLADALTAIKQTTLLAPTDAKVWYTYGALLYESGQPGASASVLEHTTVLKPDYRDAFYALALAYRAQAVDKNNKVTNQDMEKKAVDTMHHILIISPKDPAVLKTLKSWNES